MKAAIFAVANIAVIYRLRDAIYSLWCAIYFLVKNAICLSFANDKRYGYDVSAWG